MATKQTIHILTPLLLIFAVILSSCAPVIARGNVPTPVITSEIVPTPEITSEIVPTPVATDSVGAVDNPDVFVDPEFFLPALLKALNAHDTGKLQQWMTEPFFTGFWGADAFEVPPTDALKTLYDELLGAEPRLELVKDADLKALMGGVDPLSIPGSESGVMYAYLVSGWGKDGRDEAILFITMEPADNLKWHGFMQIKGGFSGARTGGNQAYTNDALGFSVFVPKDYEVLQANDSEIMFMAPGEGHPDDNRAAAFIFAEPANGRTAEQVATAISEDNKAVMGPGYTGGNITVMVIDGEAAYSVDRLTGQDLNRRVYVVHNDTLYWMMFVPDNPNAAAYLQMEDLYAMVINTFHFAR